MREIKFRGYATGIGWVYGSLVNNLWKFSELTNAAGDECCEIITGKYTGDCWEDIAEQEGEAIISVITTTVGQFTGLKDKNGNPIYEGDIVKTPDGGTDEITWDEVAFHLAMALAASPDGKCAALETKVFDKIEVIGNIYEHSNLLEQSKPQ